MTLIQFRRGAAAAWTVADTELASGEFGFETDTRKFKIGPGHWNSLDYIDAPTVLGDIAGDVIEAEIAGRGLTVTDAGGGHVQFALGGVNLGSPFALPATTWSGVSSRPALTPVAGVDQTGATDLRTTLQGIINSASAGDTICFPGGKFLISGEVVIDKPLVIRGGGGMFTAVNQGGTFPGSAATTIVTSSATANGLHITCPGVVLEDIAVVNTRSNANRPTAGTGILIEDGHNFRLSRVTVAGFYDNVRAEGRFGALDSCNILDPVRYGIYFLNDNTGEADFGDQGVSNCVIAMYGRTGADAEAALRWESGGGIRWTGNKIVAGTGPGAASIANFKYGLDIMVATGMQSGEFMVAGGGISTCTEACVRIGQNENVPNSGVTDIIISGVVIQGKDKYGILVGSASPPYVNSIRSVVVTGNTFKRCTLGGIVAYNMRGLVVGPNVWNDTTAMTGPLITLAGGNDNGISTQQVDIYRQTVVQTSATQNYTLVSDKRDMAWSCSLDGYVEYKYRRNVHAVTLNEWLTMFTIEPAHEGGSGFIDVTLSGQDAINAGGGPYFSKKIRRSFVKDYATGSAITVATVGTDELVSTTGVHGTADVGVQVVDGGSGKMLVQVARTASGSDELKGEIEVEVWGRIQKFSYGTGV